MTATPTAQTRPASGRLLFLLGLALTVFGVIGYVVQIALQHLTAPWYLPVSATLGVLLIIASLWQRRTVWRILALVFVLLVAGAEWMFLLGTRLPAYTGPVAVGQPFPAFTTQRADGSPFTERDLAGSEQSVLVFFRGRW